jgi:hypothetical protein
MMADSPTALARRLADLLARENAALERMDLPAAIALLADKRDVLATFERCGDAIPEAPDADLTDALRRLEELARENRQLLERAMAAQERVIGIVIRAAASASSGPSYGATGCAAPPTGPLTWSTQA